jgi:transposase
LDGHKAYSVVAVMDANGRVVERGRIEHQPGAIREALDGYAEGTPVALETMGSWYWIAREIEEAGCVPLLTHAGKAKQRLGQVHKSDKLDAEGLARLVHLGSLPQVWIPAAEILDVRDLPRTRLVLVAQQTRLKNRVHAGLDKYGVRVDEVTNLFGRRGRQLLAEALGQLPPETRWVVEQTLAMLDHLAWQLREFDVRIRELVKQTETMGRLKTLPGVANILAITIDLELGSIERFASPEQYSAYCGLVPILHQSGSKSWNGRCLKQCNHYLRQAYLEAANVVVRNHQRPTWSKKSVVERYRRVKEKSTAGKATVAVAHQLAVATWAMLTKGEDYREMTTD